jgi:type II secretory ATPase GspE/PulE/Tfp pilus assembly ATPase PilB-like protein
MDAFNDILKKAMEISASDIHFTVGIQPGDASTAR